MITSSYSLAFQSSGPNDAPTIVFLHGGGAGLWMWRPVIGHLPDYHCLAPDQPEHGGSREVKPFSMALAADKAAELIRTRRMAGRPAWWGFRKVHRSVVQLLASAPEVVGKAFISSAFIAAGPGAGLGEIPSIAGMVVSDLDPALPECRLVDPPEHETRGGDPGYVLPEFKKRLSGDDRV